MPQFLNLAQIKKVVYRKKKYESGPHEVSRGQAYELRLERSQGSECREPLRA